MRCPGSRVSVMRLRERLGQCIALAAAGRSSRESQGDSPGAPPPGAGWSGTGDCPGALADTASGTLVSMRYPLGLCPSAEVPPGCPAGPQTPRGTLGSVTAAWAPRCSSTACFWTVAR